MNSELLKGILLFLAGGAVGSGITAFLSKRKIDELEDSFEDRLNEEIEEIREAIEEGYSDWKETVFDEKEEDDDSEMDEEFLSALSSSIVDKANKARTKPDLIAHAKDLMDKNHYTSYSNHKEEPEKNEIPDEDLVPLDSNNEDIELIAPDEFGELPDYRTVNLYYLRDKVLVDDGGRPVNNIISMIGEDTLEEFGIYEPDSVYVRNHRDETDYAIFLRDETLSNFSL